MFFFLAEINSIDFLKWSYNKCYKLFLSALHSTYFNMFYILSTLKVLPDSILGQFWAHSTIKQKVKKISIYHYHSTHITFCIRVVPFAITEETSSTHHYHLNPGWILAFTPGIIYSLCLDTFKVTCTHHCVSTHSNFSSLKCFFLCLLNLFYSQSLQTMDIIKCLHSFVFS